MQEKWLETLLLPSKKNKNLLSIKGGGFSTNENKRNYAAFDSASNF
jgi:hypothetical protein